MVHVGATGKGSYKPKQQNTQVQKASREASLADVRVKDLNRTALELDCFNAFWELFLPTPLLDQEKPTQQLMFIEHPGQTGCVPTFPNSVARWIGYTAHYVSQSDLLRCALLALSATKLGRERQDHAMTQRGIELYGKALSRLGAELKKPQRVKKFDLPVTCRILAIYEVNMHPCAGS